jgi:hypothetical protein
MNSTPGVEASHAKAELHLGLSCNSSHGDAFSISPESSDVVEQTSNGTTRADRSRGGDCPIKAAPGR